MNKRQQVLNTLRDASQKLVPDVRPMVQAIEASPELTKGHYDQYIVALEAANGDKVKLLVLAGALSMAGANRDGLVAAFRLVAAR